MEDNGCESGQAARPCGDDCLLASAFSSSTLRQMCHKCLIKWLNYGTDSQKRDITAFIYEKYYRDVYKFIKSKDISDQDAKDIFGSVWKVAVDKLPKFEWKEDDPPETDTPIKTWLISTAALKCKEYFRQQSEVHENTTQLDDNVPVWEQYGVLDTLTRNETSQNALSYQEGQIWSNKQLQDAYAMLSKNEQSIITLTYIERKTSAEIGQILSMEASNVRQTHRRILKKLRKYFKIVEGVKS